MIEWWPLISVVALALVGTFIAGRASAKRRSINIDNLRYVRYNGEIYLSGGDLAMTLREAGHDDMANTMLGFARAAAANAASNDRKKAGP
jgi:hypothetical protein